MTPILSAMITNQTYRILAVISAAYWTCATHGLLANNLQVGAATLVDTDPNDGIAHVQFDISWENSWRVSAAPNNWDAAWVFVKFRVGPTDPVITNVNSAGNVLTVGSTAELRAGMPVQVTGGIGAMMATTIIASITSATTITVVPWPTLALSNASIQAYRIWEHARLGANGTHIAPPGSQIVTGYLMAGLPSATNWGVGAMIHRDSNGSGPFVANAVRLHWEQGIQGITIGTTLEICALALEMVNVPTGNFYAGDGSSSSRFGTGTGAGSPYQITHDGYMDYPSTFVATLGYSGPGTSADYGGGFPLGHNGFYCMKYEIDNATYAAFLNKLTRVQQQLRTATNIAPGVTNTGYPYVMSQTAASISRTAIRCPATFGPNDAVTFFCDADGDGVGNGTNDGQWTSAGFLSGADVLAFLDWSALRPMSELEYEKACRGPLYPVGGELAWGGGAGSIVLPSVHSDLNSATETVDAPANTSHSGFHNGPFRGGQFAEASGTRVTSGSSYYGIMDLSGNVGERTISAGHMSMVFQSGFWGDGSLTAGGSYDVPSWPAEGTPGYGIRGGHWASTALQQRVSDRGQISNFSTVRSANLGGRGVR